MNFLAQRNPRAAREAAAVIFAASRRLTDFPNIGRPYKLAPTHTRELVVPFGAEGYTLLYEVLADRVVIRNLKHQREASY